MLTSLCTSLTLLPVLEQEQGASELVLDLRDNRGGLVSEGVEVARLFLDGALCIRQLDGWQLVPFASRKRHGLGCSVAHSGADQVPLAHRLYINSRSAVDWCCCKSSYQHSKSGSMRSTHHWHSQAAIICSWGAGRGDGGAPGVQRQRHRGDCPGADARAVDGASQPEHSQRQRDPGRCVAELPGARSIPVYIYLP